MNSSIKTTAYIAGMVALFLILITVLGIMSGILPLRDRADAPEPTPTPPPAVDTPTPPEPKPTPDDTHVQIPDMILDEEHQVFAVNVTYSRGGTVTPSGMTTVVKGGSMTITILPDEDYTVEYVTVNGETLHVENALTLTDVQENQSIYVSFLHIAAPTPTPGSITTPPPDDFGPWSELTPSPTPATEPGTSDPTGE